MSVKVHEVCDHIVGTGLHADMLANLSWQTLSADSLNDPKSGTKRDFVEAHLAILHHVLRKTVTGRSALRHCHAPGHPAPRPEEDRDGSERSEAVSITRRRQQVSRLLRVSGSSSYLLITDFLFSVF